MLTRSSWAAAAAAAAIFATLLAATATEAQFGGGRFGFRARIATAEANHLIVRLTDDAFFQCPFVMMTEAGSASFDDREAARLREYLLKGGSLWVNDFWDSYAWDV